MSEELKIIMDTISQLGQAGKEAFIWWLVVKYLFHYLTVIVFLGCAAFAVCFTVKRITAMSHGNQLGNELCKLLNVDGNSRYNSDVWDNEYSRPRLKAEILTKVRELAEKK